MPASFYQPRRLCFWTDSPPLVHQDIGNSGIARQFVNILQRHAGSVLTRRFRRANRVSEISEAAGGIPLIRYPDVSGLGLRRFFPTLGQILDLLLFTLWLPRNLVRLRRRGVAQLFVLCGADGWFLWNVWLMQRYGPPTELYLVDDIEDSARIGCNRLEQKTVSKLLGRVLRKASMVWAISPGLADLLRDRFSVAAAWLPLPMADEPARFATAGPASEETRRIVFVGGLNHLYAEPLRQLYGAISKLNEQRNGAPAFELELLCYADPQPFLETLPDLKWVKFHQRLSKAERLARLRSALACFLPYSFEEKEAAMVSTSFSCKFLEYLRAGRPILVYGPKYASIPRYFADERLGLCATSFEELTQLLSQIEKVDVSTLVEGYFRSWEKNHSPEAIRSKLLGAH
jgi:hypothetical protein